MANVGCQAARLAPLRQAGSLAAESDKLADIRAQKKTPPSGWPHQVKMLGGVPLPQITLNLERESERQGLD
jgi:hypothetical protein